jgi:hypothetical protein
MPIRTTERTDSHRRDACAPLQKSKSKELLVLCVRQDFISPIPRQDEWHFFLFTPCHAETRPGLVLTNCRHGKTRLGHRKMPLRHNPTTRRAGGELYCQGMTPLCLGKPTHRFDKTTLSHGKPTLCHAATMPRQCLTTLRYGMRRKGKKFPSGALRASLESAYGKSFKPCLQS